MKALARLIAFLTRRPYYAGPERRSGKPNLPEIRYPAS